MSAPTWFISLTNAHTRRVVHRIVGPIEQQWDTYGLRLTAGGAAEPTATLLPRPAGWQSVAPTTSTAE
jgi:hypothetical protein